MTESNKEEIKKQIREAYIGILSEQQIGATTDWWLTLLSKQRQEWVEEITKKLTRHNAILKSMLAEVQDRNGLPYCKNCGLSEEDLIYLSSLLSKDDNK